MLKKNLIANFLGQGWVALMSLLFIPLYIKYLGIEAYGLIGLFALLQTLLSLLDMGMTPTLAREMARFTGGTHSAQSIRDLLRSIEVISLSIAVLIAGGTVLGGKWISTYWLRSEALPVEVVAHNFSIMGLVTALRFIEGVYRSTIVGLQRQVLLNVVNSFMATMRGFGAVCLLIWVSPTVEAYFLWQGVISLLSLAVLASITYRVLPKAARPGRFSKMALLGIGRYAGGMLGITVLSLLTMQADKIILTKLLSLSEFGYYSLASVVAGVTYMLVGPIGQAWSPRLSELKASDQQSKFIETYHQGAQLVSVFVGSAAIVLIIFAETVLQLWTQDNALAHRSATLLSLLVLGNLLNSLLWIPYQAQLAYGWTGLAFRLNLLAVIMIVPAFYLLIPRYGPEGAAWVWISLNALYLLIGIHFMYRKILTKEKWRWYKWDVILPLVTATITALLMRWFTPPAASFAGQLAVLALVSIFTLVAATLAASSLREQFRFSIQLLISNFKIKTPLQH
jgi:O-antigen/teichoic acid export membrane protein